MHVSESQLIPIEIDAQVPPGKGVAIQCFSGMENVEDGSYEITHLVTLQIFNLKLDALTNEEHFEEYVLLPYLLAVGSSPFGMSNFRLRGVHIFDIAKSYLEYKVIESVRYQGNKIKVCSIKPKLFPPPVVLLVCFQLVVFTFIGDYQFIYRSLGHAAHFLHDKYRCIFCTYNFQTTEVGRPRTIEEFYTLAAAHKEKPTLQGESTYGVVHDPCFLFLCSTWLLRCCTRFLVFFKEV